MEKAIYNSIEQAVNEVDANVMVRYGYLSEVQGQNLKLPVVLVTPMAATVESSVVGLMVKSNYVVKAMALFGDTYGKPTDARAAGRMTSRLDIYDQAQTLLEAIFNQVAKDLAGQANVLIGAIDPVQLVSTQTLTGKVITFRVVELKSYC